MSRTSAADAFSILEALVTALAKERCAFVVDDAHLARSDAAELVAHLGAMLEGDQRLVVLARHLPPGAERLRRAEYFHLGSKDLALTTDEILTLCRSGFGLSTARDAAAALGRATGGWTAATVLAVARAARTGEDAENVAVAASSASRPGGALAAILEEAIAALGAANLAHLAQIARLPLLDDRVVELATATGLFERGLAAGLPFVPSRGTWWDLPGPVRDYLATFAEVRRESMRAAAQEYRRRGELAAALELLLAVGDPAEAAAVLATTAPEDLEGLDNLELQAIYDQLPPEVVHAFPGVLMPVARGHGIAFQYARREAVIAEAAEIAASCRDDVLARQIAAEHINDLCRDFAYDECVVEARRVLAAAAPDERYTRARCYYALARALCRRLDAEGRRDGAAIAEGAQCFQRAIELYRALGMRSAAASVIANAVSYIDYPDGRAAAAMAALEEALNLVADRPRRWAWVQCTKAKIAAELGLDVVSRSSAADVLRVAEELDDEVFRAFGHWRLAMLCSYNGDAEGTLEHFRLAELHRAENWWGQASGDFLAEAADHLDRVGHTALAYGYLERAKREPKDAAHLVALAAAALEARHGDPVLADARLDEAERHPLDLRERWRVSLLRAYAAFRRGEHGAAGSLAAHAFEEAARLGQPQLPMIRERSLTEALLGLAAETGQPAALALRASTLPLSLCLLGGFSLTEGGRPVPVGVGQEAKLLKLVAASGGRAHAERVIETLWPEVGAAAGRNRLRTVLNRLRATAGEVLLRDGDVLMLAESVRVDLADFLAEGRKALALAPSNLALASALARGAMARYRGELLADDPYEEWAEQPRQRARQTMLELLDLCASDASRRGDLDGLRRVVERTIELAPYDDVRYLHAASTLLRQGRRGEALAIVRRARSAFAELGLEPPGPLLDLERSIVA